MDRKGLLGIAKLGLVFSVLVVIIFVLGAFLTNVFAATAPTASVWTPSLAAPDSNEIITISLTDNDPVQNITVVNITFPTVNEISGNGQFTYITSSQIIVGNTSTLSFSNSSGENAVLTWSNSTVLGFVAANGTINVSFNVSLPDYPGSYTFNISTQYTDFSTNSTNFMVNVSQYASPGTLPSSWGDNPGQPPFFWVNISNDVDFFYFNNMSVVMVANFTSPTLNVGVPGLNVTGNFTSIGGSAAVLATDQGGGLYQFNVSTNFSAVPGGINMMGPGLPGLTVMNGTDTIDLSQYGNTAPIVMVNMSTMPSCPPDNHPDAGLPGQIAWDNGTVFKNWNVLNCTVASASICNNVPGPAYWNDTHVILCGPVWGPDTTNFSAIAADPTGNFSNVNLVLDIPGRAKINFTQGVDFAGQNGQRAAAIMEFAMTNLMGNGKIGVNDSEWDGSNASGTYKPNMNITALLTLYNVSNSLGITDPFIQRGSFNGSNDPLDLITCPPSICDPSLISFDGQNLTFQVGHFSTLVVGNTTHTLNFTNISSSTQTVVVNHNTTFDVSITNNGNSTQETYNLTVQNASSGVTTYLNVTSITLNQSESAAVRVTVNSNTTGISSVYVQAQHYNDTGGNDNVILNSSDSPDNLNFVTTVNNHDVTITAPTGNISNNLNVPVNFTNTTVVDWCLAVDINGSNVTANQTGCLSGGIKLNLTEGANQNITLYVNDTLGHIFTDSSTFTLDKTAPTVTLNMPVNNSNESSSSVVFNWTVTDNIDALLTCNVTVDGVANQTGVSAQNNTATTATVTGLVDGSHNWSVTCVDDVANSTTSSTLFFTVDTTVPAVTSINSPTDSSSVNGVIVVNATVSEDTTTVDTVRFNVSNSSFSSVTNMGLFNGFYNASLNTSTLADGTYTITILANNTAGGLNDTESVSITVDSTVPSLSNWSYNFINKQLTLNFDDVIGISSVTPSSLSLFNITHDDGSSAGLDGLGTATVHTSTNSSSIVVNFTTAQDTKMRDMTEFSQGEIDMASGAAQDIAGNNVSATVDLTISSTTTYGIDISLTGSQWNSFNLPRTILANLTSLNNNFTVGNVVFSIEGNYQIIYYYNTNTWTSYVSGRPTNDFTSFDDDTGTNMYWSYMTVSDRLQIV